jgi:hypothetical protein
MESGKEKSVDNISQNITADMIPEDSRITHVDFRKICSWEERTEFQK